MRSLYRAIDSAHFVVLIWFGSAMLPILLLASSSFWGHAISVGIIMILGVGITQLRAKKKAEGRVMAFL